MAIKTSHIGYVRIKKWDLYGETCVPSGKVREDSGVTQAEFILVTGNHPERKVWLSRDEIMV